MRKNKTSVFYKIYFSLLGVFAVALGIGCFCLNNFISEYNKGIHETVAKQFFEDNFLNVNPQRIIDASGITPSEFETEEDLVNFIYDSLSDKQLTYTSVSSVGNNEEKRYIVKSDNYKIATFCLLPDENGDYYVKSLELHLPASFVKEFKILESGKLFLNGVQVSEDYITEIITNENQKYLPENTPCPAWAVYTITGLTKEPEYSLTDRNGNSPEFVEEDGRLVEKIIYDTDNDGATERIRSGARQYAICMQNDASKGSVYPYFKRGTDLYESIRTAENTFVWDHSGYSFEEEEVSEFFRYNESIVSCRVKFAHILHKQGRQDYRDYTDITYFAEKIDGKYYIFARYNN